MDVCTQVMLDVSLLGAAKSRGMKLAFDCRGKDDQWILTNWAPTWPQRRIAVEQNNNLNESDTGSMNDVATAFGALSFHPGADTAVREGLLSVLDDSGVIFGWGDFDELKMVPSVSSHGLFYVASEWSRNLALLSSYRDATLLPLKQPASSTKFAKADPTKHYVAFHFTGIFPTLTARLNPYSTH